MTKAKGSRKVHQAYAFPKDRKRRLLRARCGAGDDVDMTLNMRVTCRRCLAQRKKVKRGK